MCGRYTLASINPADVHARFGVDPGETIVPRYNIAPGDEVLAVSTDRAGCPRAQRLRWGLVPAWSAGPRPAQTVINARVETVAQRPAFRGALARMRCLILADGFYEWRRTPGAPKQAFHITRRDHAMFSFAGLWAVWHGPDGATLRSCTVLTTQANAAVARLHDRMPVILDREAERAWLDPGTSPGELLRLLGGLAATDTALRAVGSAVNDARYDGPECLAPAGYAQPTLF